MKVVASTGVTKRFLNVPSQVPIGVRCGETYLTRTQMPSPVDQERYANLPMYLLVVLPSSGPVSRSKYSLYS